MDCLETVPSTEIPHELIDFMTIMSSAKYSTFLTAEKEDQYHNMHIDTVITTITNFDASCKTSILFVPTVQKYISSIKTQQISDDFL